MPQGRMSNRKGPRGAMGALGMEIKVRIVPCDLCSEFFKGERVMTYEFVFVLTVPGVDGLLPWCFSVPFSVDARNAHPAAFATLIDARISDCDARGGKNLPRKQNTPLSGPSWASGICRRGGSFTDSDGFRWFPLGGNNGTMSRQGRAKVGNGTAVPFSACSPASAGAPGHSMNGPETPWGRPTSAWPSGVRLRLVSSQPLLANIFFARLPFPVPTRNFLLSTPTFLTNPHFYNINPALNSRAPPSRDTLLTTQHPKKKRHSNSPHRTPVHVWAFHCPSPPRLAPPSDSTPSAPSWEGKKNSPASPPSNPEYKSLAPPAGRLSRIFAATPSPEANKTTPPA